MPETQTTPLTATFGARLRQAREDQDLSQSDLAARTGLHPSAIAHFESNRRAPSFANLVRLSEALSLAIEALTGKPALDVSDPLTRDLLGLFVRLDRADREIVVALARLLRRRDTRKGSPPRHEEHKEEMQGSERSVKGN